MRFWSIPPIHGQGLTLAFPLPLRQLLLSDANNYGGVGERWLDFLLQWTVECLLNQEQQTDLLGAFTLLDCKQRAWAAGTIRVLCFNFDRYLPWTVMDNRVKSYRTLMLLTLR